MSRHADLMLRLDMVMNYEGTPFRHHYAEASKRRGNRRQGDHATDISHLVPPRSGQNHRLWITDRIMEPQTIPHFIEFLMHGRLPGDDRKTSQPLLTVEEAKNLSRPFSDWAPAPFNQQERSTAEWMGIRIGSWEDSARLWPIAKELHAMKSRLWEGIPPLSERRWKELQLDDPRHFKDACQYFIAVIDVFAYLNNPRTKNALRTTYNLIWDHLEPFELAINNKRKEEAEGDVYEVVSVTGLWYQYIKAHYDVICDNAHQWVIEHIDRIRKPILLELESHQPQSHQIDDGQRQLTDKIHDLAENTAQADYIICIPMDGYKGANLPAQEHLPLTAAHRVAFREEPISWSANIYYRASDYSQRVRFLDRKEMYERYEREGLRFVDSNTNDPRRLLITCTSQINAQTKARYELRGSSEQIDVDRWIDYARRPTPRLKGFAAFRLCHEHDDGEWKEFKTKFETDIADWGWGKNGIDDVRQACKIHWIEGEEVGDIEAAKKKFNSIMLDLPVHERMFLAVDKATVESYLQPNSTKFVLAVDAQYKPAEEGEAEEEDVESPGYKGTVRILGSLLWDELSAMQTTQGVFLRDLWPFAMSDAEQVYKGPLVGAPVLKFPNYGHTKAWEIASVVVPLIIGLAKQQEPRPVSSIGRV